MTRLSWLLCLALLAGCGDDPVLPPAEPLAVPPESIDARPAAQAGPYPVKVVREVTITDEVSNERSVSVHYPGKGANHPLLLFSHGNWSDRYSYDRVIDYWVSHGYVVLSTDHADCCSPVKGIMNSLRYGQLGLIDRRVTDLEFLLASVDKLETLLPDFVGKADTSRVAATGHSFGAFSAQQLGGASAMNPDNGDYRYQVNPSIRAVVALNPPGPMFDTITADSWRGLQLPTLVTTGTWDVQKGFWEQWQLHLMSFENSPAGNKYALVVEGADHYLGNLICRTKRDMPAQEDALRMVQLTTTAFLDAQLKSDRVSRGLLTSGLLADATGGFARILRR